MSAVIEDIVARKILNNRGDETIEVDVVTSSSFGRASAPAGESRGKAEVAYYPPGGVDQAIKKLEEIVAPELIGANVDFQEEIDRKIHEMDGTSDLRALGGNTAYALSLASAEAAANSCNSLLFHYLGGYLAHEMPYPLGNLLSGGKHGKGNTPNIQEFLVIPHGAESFLEAAITNARIHRLVGGVLKKKDRHFTGGRSDEGAWMADVGDLEALDILAEACEKIEDELGVKSSLGLDVAASSLWDSNKKTYLHRREGREIDSGEQIDFISELVGTYRLVYVEDPLHEDDFEGFAELTSKLKNCLICGDDLFATNIERLSRGVKLEAGNAIIIKMNQVGTLTDTLETVEAARRVAYVPVMSHRSGDTTDTHIAHLAVAFRCPIIKTGIVEGARTAKLNELIRIEEFLGDRAKMVELQFS